MDMIGRVSRIRAAAWWLAACCLAVTCGSSPAATGEQYSVHFQGAGARGVAGTWSDLAFKDRSFAQNGDEITTGGGDFVAAGFADGMVLRVDGSGLNDGVYTIAAVETNRLLLAPLDQLTDEVPGVAVSLSAAWAPRIRLPETLPADPRAAVRATALLDVPVMGAAGAGGEPVNLADVIFLDGGLVSQDSIRSLGGDFRDLGFAAGTWFAVRGSAANDGLYRVAEVREEIRGSGLFNELLLSVAAHLSPEGTAAAPSEATLVPAAKGFTAELWVRLPEYAEGEFPAKWEMFMGKGRAWAISRYSNTDRVTFTTWSDGEVHDIVGATALTPRRWHHIAAVYDGRVKSLYIDGRLEAQSAWAGPLRCDEHAVELGNAPLVANDPRLKAGRALNGWLDVCRLWDVPRSAADIRATMQRRLRGSETGLLGAWRFDEERRGDSLTALDSSFHGFNGALLDIDPAAGRVDGYDTSFDPPEPKAVILGSALPGNYALQLNGIDQFVQVQNEVIFDFTEGFALELWYRLDRLPTGGPAALISKGDTAYELGLDEEGIPYLTVAGLAAPVIGLAAPDPEAWHHLAGIAMKNSATDLWDLTLMVDGAIENQVTGLTGTPTSNDLPLCFGARPTPAKGSEGFFPGQIDEIRAWAVPQSPERIAQRMNRTLFGTEPGLAGWWPLDEGDGVVATDRKKVVTDPDSLLTLQFEQLAYDGNQIKRYPSVYREDSPDPAIDPEGARDDAFVVQTSTASPTGLAVKGEAMPDYPGSTMVYNTIPLSDAILSMDGGEAFRVLSIDVGDLQKDSDPGTRVTFRATVAGTTVERTVELNGGDTVPETFFFERFNSITELRWKQMPNYHLFDNIVLQKVADLSPWNLKADGLLINLPDWARVDAPLQLDPALPAQYALSFDGDGDWVEAPVPAGMPADWFAMRQPDGTPKGFTLEAWIRPHTTFSGSAPDSVHPFETIVRQGEVGWGLALDAAGYLRYWIADDPTASLASDRPLDSGVWQHVALVVDPAHNTVAFFLNGAPAGDYETTIISVDEVNRGLALGADGTVAPSGWLHADLDEVRLWGYVRDASEIYAFSNRTLPAGMGGLLAYWRFNDGIGITCADSSGNGVTAMLRGTAKALDLPTWIYGPGPPNRDGMWALQFDGIDDYLRTPDSLAFNPKADRIHGDVSSVHLQPGDHFTVAETAHNNKELILAVGRGDSLTVRPADPAADPLDALVDEGPVEALFTLNRLQRDALVFQHYATAADQIVSFSGSFTPLGLSPGDLIVVRDSAHNDGEYRIADVDPMVLTLDPAATLTQEGEMTGDTPPAPVTVASATLYRGMRLPDLVFVDNDTEPAALTIEAWVRPEPIATLDPGEVERRRTIVMKERDGWGLALDANGFPVLLLQGMPAARAAAPEAAFADDIWQHLAVTVDEAANTVVFYRNGAPVGTFHPSVSLATAATGDLFTGRQGEGTTASPARHHYKGAIDELRIWTVVRSPEAIAQSAMRQLFRGDSTLAAYWNFNRFDPDALDTFNAEVNFLQIVDESGNGNTASMGPGVMSVRAYIPGLYDLVWDGDYWDTGDEGDGGLDLSRSTSARGLWVGKVILNAVSEVQTASSTSPGQVTPTADTLAYTILLHVDTLGRVRLLKSVIVLAAEGASTEEPLPEEEGLNSDPLTPVGAETAETAPTHIALVTDDRRLVAITPVDGAKPQRISAPAFDFEGNELLLQGGVGPAKALTGTVILPRLHPTNPFRHKYHPDHRNINPDNPDYGFEINRKLTIRFDPTDDGLATPGGYGVQRLTGTYEEQVRGLHKVPIIARGTLQLNRISTVGVLNE